MMVPDTPSPVISPRSKDMAFNYGAAHGMFTIDSASTDTLMGENPCGSASGDVGGGCEAPLGVKQVVALPSLSTLLSEISKSSSSKVVEESKENSLPTINLNGSDVGASSARGSVGRSSLQLRRSRSTFAKLGIPLKINTGASESSKESVLASLKGGFGANVAIPEEKPIKLAPIILNDEEKEEGSNKVEMTEATDFSGSRNALSRVTLALNSDVSTEIRNYCKKQKELRYAEQESVAMMISPRNDELQKAVQNMSLTYEDQNSEHQRDYQSRKMNLPETEVYNEVEKETIRAVYAGSDPLLQFCNLDTESGKGTFVQGQSHFTYILPHVILSSDIFARQLDLLEENKVSHIINCAIEIPNYFENIMYQVKSPLPRSAGGAASKRKRLLMTTPTSTTIDSVSQHGGSPSPSPISTPYLTVANNDSINLTTTSALPQQTPANRSVYRSISQASRLMVPHHHSESSSSSGLRIKRSNTTAAYRGPRFKYLKLDWEHSVEDIQEEFEDVFDLIKEAKESNTRVIVHCSQGICRSAALIIAYIMKERGLSFQASYDFVRERAPMIAPNLNLVYQLNAYESNLMKKDLP